MKELIYPTSSLRTSEATTRITALLVAALLWVYVRTGEPAIMMYLAADYGIRAFTNWRYTPISYLAHFLVRVLQVPDHRIDKAPKMFAARVGMLYAAASALLFQVSPAVSLIVAAILLGFAMLEAVLNICVGCLMYARIVFPFHTNR